MTYHIIYKVTNTINGKYYIGKHSTNNINDGYMGSSKLLKNAIKKYGKNNFSKIILEHCLTEYDAFIAEATYVTEKEITDPNCYNLRTGGLGGYKHSVETKELMRKKALEDSTRSSRITGDKNPNYNGKCVTEEYRNRMSKSMTGKNSGESHWTFGKEYTMDERREISDRIKALNLKHSEEHKTKMSKKYTGSGNPMNGIMSPTTNITIDGTTKPAHIWKKELCIGSMKELIQYLSELIQIDKKEYKTIL